MSSNVLTSPGGQTLGEWLLNKKNWFTHFIIVALISIAGQIYLGQQTYSGAPPLVDFVDSQGNVVASADTIKNGKEIFHIRGLMAWGAFWGDGADRGPDFSADALHRTVVTMRSFYEEEMKQRTGVTNLTGYEKDAIAQRVVRDLHNNTYDEKAGHITLNDAQLAALQELNGHYTRMFIDPTYGEYMSGGQVEG
jgi:nitric oxide reductase subunit B